MDYYSKLQSRLPSSSSSSSHFPPHRTQLHPRMVHPHSKPSSLRRWIPFLLLLLPVLLYLLPASLLPSRPSPAFSLLIDASASASRIHVFEYVDGLTGIPVVGKGEGVSVKVWPGLKGFWEDPEEAGRSLVELLEFARRKVPRAKWGKTEVRLLETGGLRGVEVGVRRRILESCRVVLRASGFAFRDEFVSTITGRKIGVYAWVAANYVLGTLGGDPERTIGVVEINAVSAEITFVSSKPPPTESLCMLKLPSVSYNLYTSSMRQIRQEGMWDFLDAMHYSKSIATSSSSIELATISHCIPKGYIQNYNINFASTASNKKLFGDSRGNFSECRSSALALLRESQGTCSHPPCRGFSHFLPKLQGDTPHAESFFYATELFGLVPGASLMDLEAAGNHYCQDDWTQLKKKHHNIDEADLLKYCFSSAYIAALLGDGFGIPKDQKSIGTTNQAGVNPLDWTLGAFIMHSVSQPELESKSESIDHAAGDDSVTYITLFAILLSVAFGLFYVFWRQRPQFKMIYDLEKGHYIVTRMPR